MSTCYNDFVLHSIVKPVLTRTKISPAMQTITDSGEDNSRRPRSGDSEIPNSSKLEPYSSEQQRFEADLPCMPVPNNVTINTLPLVTRHTFQFVSRNKLEVPVRHKKAPDAVRPSTFSPLFYLLFKCMCISHPCLIILMLFVQLEMNTNSVVFSPKEQTHCNLEIFSPNCKSCHNFKIVIFDALILNTGLADLNIIFLQPRRSLMRHTMKVMRHYSSILWANVKFQIIGVLQGNLHLCIRA